VDRERRVAIWVEGTRSKRDAVRRLDELLSGREGEGSRAGSRARVPAPHRMGMDITWITDRIAVGGGIWSAENMAAVAREGITHIIDMQIEFDDTPLAKEHDIRVLWNPTDDDFELKPAELFERGVEFAKKALNEDESKVFIHCAAGVHRAPMMTLAVLGSMGWDVDEAMELIEARRPVADFADVYVRSVERYLANFSPQEKRVDGTAENR